MTSGADSRLMRRYLLGELPEKEAERIEETYFDDDDLFAGLLAAEDDLIEEYLHGGLARGERQQFEMRFLSTDRGRAKIILAAALERTRVRRRLRPNAFAVAAAAAAVVLFVISLALWREM
jgi:hypothetical protein